MKNYKFIVPIALVVLLLLGVYLLYDSRSKTEQRYQSYLAEAREYRRLGIMVDAEDYYQRAYKIHPSSALGLELAACYDELYYPDKAASAGKHMIDDYPTEVSTYEFLIDHYYRQGSIRDVYKYAQIYRKRGLHSDQIEEILTAEQYTARRVSSYHNVTTFCAGACAVAKKDYWGFVDETGNVIAALRYDNVGPYSDSGFAGAKLARDKDAFFLDKNGNKRWVLEGIDQIDELGYVNSSNIVPLRSGDKWAYYDMDGNRLFGDFDEVSAMNWGIAAVRTGDLWTLRDSTGTPLNQETYLGVALNENHIACWYDRFFVEQGDGWHLLDSKLNPIGTTVYNGARIFCDENGAAVRIGDLWGFINHDGSIMLEPKYEDARSFSNGLAAVEVNGLWGYIDTEGNMVIEPQFFDARDFTASGSYFAKTQYDWTLYRLYSAQYLN